MKYELINSNIEDKDLISLVFENRGVPQEKIFDFIDCSKDYRTDPFLYVNMEKALEKVHNNMHRQLRTGILVDCDCDGYSASTIFYKTVKKLYKDADLVFLLHEDKKHGVSEDIEKQIKEQGIEFLVVLDAGSNQADELIKLKEKGIDILVIDHHEAEYTDEILIVNNQYNDINKGLSGGAMALKFAEAFLGKKEAEEFMDIAAVSILSDNMPMNNLENRYYVKFGLSKLKNNFFKVLIDNNSAETKDVSFNISPTINAIVRLGTMEDKELLIKAMVDMDGEVELPTRKNGKKTQMYNYVDAVIKISKWRRDEQKQLVEEEIQKIELEHDNPINIVLLDEDFNRNITGYFANVVSGKTLKPTLAIKYNEDDELYEGSARSSSVPDFKDFLLDTDLFKYCEGHQGAFGLGITQENIDKLNAELRSMNLPTEKTHKVDKIFSNGELTSSSIRSIANLDGVWGKDMETPKFAIRLEDIRPSFIGAGGNTFKIGRRDVNFIKFNVSQELKDEMYRLGEFDLDVVGTFEVNRYKGAVYPQVKIEDMKIVKKEIDENKALFDENDDFGDFGDLF